ncbi:GTP-binding protein 2 [Copidosoma floridanum]|uniref:GTP-binding protein 2 n=1 Tax=Copidosoma floridanum TaxID=29053 RepID=UPI0006C9C388|nr:GTP-binding protein 2 [Copidosoma floridanum]
MESFLDLFNTDNSNSKFKKLSLDKYENEDIDLSDSNNSTSEDSRDRLPPEPEQGNIEYKLKLVNPSNQRFEHLVTQMKWRLQEGHGKAIYQIGVEDNGRLAGLSKDEMNASLKTLEDMATRLGATIDILKERFAYHKCNNKKTKTKTKNRIEDKKVAEVLIRKLRRDDKDEKCVTDLRLAVMGSQDAGKSTLLGVLTQGELDNGRGRSRLNMLRHLHEIKSGRTSSISHEIIGFDNKGHVLNYAEMSTAEKICEHASKVVTFIDLAGHRKYLRTTILGLTGYSPHYVMLVVAPPINEVVQEHVALCLALHVPFFVVFTKVDLGYYNPQETLSELKSISTFQGCHKNFLLHNSSNNNSHQDRQNNESNVISVFSVSCVTGEGLSDLKNFIRDLVPVELSPPDLDPDSCLFQIDEIFSGHLKEKLPFYS